jgi:hypothetical protein
MDKPFDGGEVKHEAGTTPQLTEGGSTTDEPFRDLNLQDKRPDARHRRVVTLSLIGLLSVVIIGHYVCVMILEWNGKRVDSINAAFNAALPVVAGLVGAAVTYYFTRNST